MRDDKRLQLQGCEAERLRRRAESGGWQLVATMNSSNFAISTSQYTSSKQQHIIECTGDPQWLSTVHPAWPYVGPGDRAVPPCHYLVGLGAPPSRDQVVPGQCLGPPSSDRDCWGVGPGWSPTFSLHPLPSYVHSTLNYSLNRTSGFWANPHIGGE